MKMEIEIRAMHQQVNECQGRGRQRERPGGREWALVFVPRPLDSYAEALPPPCDGINRGLFGK